MDPTALAQRCAHGALDGAHKSGRAVGDDQQRASQPALTQPGQELFPRVAGLRGSRLQSDEHRFGEAVKSTVPQEMWGEIVEKLEELEHSESLDVGTDAYDDVDDAYDPMEFAEDDDEF